MIDTIRNEIRAILAAAEIEGGIESRIKVIRQSIEQNIAADDDASRLRAYTYILHGLLLHARTGFSYPSEVNLMYQSALKLLLAESVGPDHYRLSFLYGDLHAAMSQIRFREGEPWLSGWHHQMAVVLSKESQGHSKEYLALGEAKRLARLGLLPVAIESFRVAEGHSSPIERAKARTGLVRSFRWQCQFDQARNLASDALSWKDIRDVERLELTWELQLLDAIQTGSPKCLIRMTKKGRDHYVSSYVIEARLWAYSHNSMVGMEKIPKLATLRADKELGIQDEQGLNRFLSVMEQCYDEDFSTFHRLTNLGDSLNERQRWISLDYELLALACGCRWLHRKGLTDMLAYTMREYNRICSLLSNGLSRDIFGLLVDISDFNEKVSAGQP